MKKLIAILAVFALTGCANISSLGTSIQDFGSKIGHVSVSNEIVALNAELVKAQPKVKLWAARCVTALGYVKTISQFTNAISPSVLADAEAAAATCAALTADPTVTAASVATGIAQSIVTLQNAAQVPK